MSNAKIFPIDDVPKFARGDGVQTILLVGKELCASTPFTTGMTTFPAGKEVPFHSHNCDEQVTIIDGVAGVDVEGRERVKVGKHDTTFIPAGESHRFVNLGDGPLTILWIYGADEVTRTFSETGQTVEHLSAADRVA